MNTKHWRLGYVVLVAAMLLAWPCHGELKTTEEIIEWAAEKGKAATSWSFEARQRFEPVTAINDVKVKDGMYRVEHRQFTPEDVPVRTDLLDNSMVRWYISPRREYRQVHRLDIPVVLEAAKAAGHDIDPAELMRWVPVVRLIDFITGIDFPPEMNIEHNIIIKCVGTDLIDGESVYTMEFRPFADEQLRQQDGSTVPELLYVWQVSQKDGFLRRYSLFASGIDDPVVEIDYRNVQVNPQLDDALFTFTPEDSDSVLDATDAFVAWARGDIEEKPSFENYRGMPTVGREAPISSGDAPTFETVTLDGEPLALAEYRGRPVVLVFWAATCEACRAMTPELVALRDQYAERGLAMIGVSLDEDPAALETYLAEESEITWPQIVDDEVAQQYGIKAVPQLVLINAEGVVHGHYMMGPAFHAAMEEHAAAIGHEPVL